MATALTPMMTMLSTTQSALSFWIYSLYTNHLGLFYNNNNLHTPVQQDPCLSVIYRGCAEKSTAEFRESIPFTGCRKVPAFSKQLVKLALNFPILSLGQIDSLQVKSQGMCAPQCDRIWNITQYIKVQEQFSCKFL